MSDIQGKSPMDQMKLSKRVLRRELQGEGSMEMEDGRRSSTDHRGIELRLRIRVILQETEKRWEERKRTVCVT